jgi:PAS domain S-box-containing protein
MITPSHQEPVDHAAGARRGRVSITRDGRVRDCDAAAEQVLRRRRETLSGRPFREFVAPAYRGVFDRFLRGVVAGHRPGATALGLDAADGGTTAVLLDASRDPTQPYFDVALVELHAAIGPASAAASIGLSARTLADALPAMVSYWTRELRCAFANKAYLEWFGRTPDELVGIEMRELLGAELFQKSEPYIRGALDGEPQGFERTLVKASGESGHTWVQYVPDAVDGTVRGFFVLVSDITDFKRARQAVRDNEARFRAVIDASPVAYALTDASQAITYLNPACRRSFGYSRDDVPTLGRWWAATVADEPERRRVATVWRGRLEEARAAQRPFEPMELRLRCKDGSERTVVAHATALGPIVADADLIVLRDVTEERRLEREVLDTATREQHRLGGELHEGLAKDLAAASMTLDVLCASADPDASAARTAELAELADRLRRCVEITRSMAYTLSPVELGYRGLPGALERLGESARARRRVQVVVTLTGFEHRTLEPLLTEHVYRVAREAFENALRHSHGTQFGIDATLSGDRLTLSVRDDGIGLPQPHELSGPGFSIMRYRARAVGGQLDVEAPPDGGTVVRLTCPLRDAGARLEVQEPAPHDGGGVTWH